MTGAPSSPRFHVFMGVPIRSCVERTTPWHAGALAAMTRDATPLTLDANLPSEASFTPRHQW